MIQLQHLNKVYYSEAGEVQALREVDLSIREGEYIVVIGMSGSGKSTLLNIISGIDRPTSGSVQVKGQDLNRLNENELARWRGRHVGIVFQFYQLLPTLSALDNVIFAMNLVDKIPSKERKDKAIAHLTEVGLEGKIRKFPNELSGGEGQRVAIARSMANDPEIIIADEPTGNLDSKTGEQINNLFNKLNTLGTTVITVTHANVEDRTYDQVIKIKDGFVNNEKDLTKFTST